MKRGDLKNILVPIDFSEMSEQSIETAQRLAQRFDASIHLVHIHENWYPIGLMAPGAPVSLPMLTFRQDDADRIRKRLQLLSKKHGIPMTNCYMRSDVSVFSGVCTVARQIAADLIVMQTHSSTGMMRFFEGSHAERIVQHSPCPVLVARSRRQKAGRIRSRAPALEGINEILVPVDFSPSSFQALEYAIKFAQSAAARLIVFHAVHLDYAFSADGYTKCDLPLLINEARENAAIQMLEFIRRAKFREVQFEIVIKIAPPASEICVFADDRDVDLIIAATHGRTGLKHLLLGSIAEQLVRRAHQPVLVVPSLPERSKARLARVTRPVQQPMSQPPKHRTLFRSSDRLTKNIPSLLEHPFPERRKTNKFRESHVR
jgi:nucleotide-binding universal stress UspA family protein